MMRILHKHLSPEDVVQAEYAEMETLYVSNVNDDPGIYIYRNMSRQSDSYSCYDYVNM